MSGHTCCCGRAGLRSGGWLSHLRACPVERARSAAFVQAIEQGRDPRAASAAAVRAALAAAAPPRRACLDCPKRAQPGSPWCAEHD